MNKIERDDLLSRLDERTEIMMKELEDQNDHLAKLNGRLEKHDSLLTKHETTLYSKNGLVDRVSTNTKNITKLIICVSIISAGIGGGVAKLINLLS